MQLQNETYVDAVAMLSQTVEETENNINEQTGEVLGKVANYLDYLADFINESQVIIDTNVSETLHDCAITYRWAAASPMGCMWVQKHPVQIIYIDHTTSSLSKHYTLLN